MTRLHNVADRLLTRLVPKAEAEAVECACDAYSHWWGQICYCSGGYRLYRRYYTCSSNCRSSSYYCRHYTNDCG